jgi:hypothetical protein
MGGIMACEIIFFNLKESTAVSLHAAVASCEPAAAAFAGTMPVENNNS